MAIHISASPEAWGGFSVWTIGCQKSSVPCRWRDSSNSIAPRSIGATMIRPKPRCAQYALIPEPLISSSETAFAEG